MKYPHLQTPSPKQVAPVGHFSHWSHATSLDIRETLGGGDFSVKVGDFVGRGDYFIAISDSPGKRFIKVLLQTDDAKDILRRVSGETLASRLDIPSCAAYSALTAERIVESTGFPGDFYIVSAFQPDAVALSPTDPETNDALLHGLGKFIHRLESVKIPQDAIHRRANDLIDLLVFLSRDDQSAAFGRLPSGGQKAIEIISLESKLISELANELHTISTNRTFSHGDLKLSQLLLTENRRVFVCDWEECGSAPALNDLCFALADVFYSQIRHLVDKELDSTSNKSMQSLYDDAVRSAVQNIMPILDGYIQGRGKELSTPEKRIVEIRLGLAGLFRLYTVSAKSHTLRPRELALASIGVQIASGSVSPVFDI